MSPDAPPRTLRSRESLPRQVVEFFACLIIAVALFKTIQAEGYLISTGSMAPALLGHHKQVTCPSCRYPFAIGMTQGRAPNLAVCPNCGCYDIDIRDLSPNDGDQLLVHKLAFELRPPRRWEVAVFRNPQKPTEAYVKRVAGLPGETIEINGGDVYADGHICTKSLSAQRGTRINVFNNNFRPAADDPQWRPRWTPAGHWKATETGFVVDARQQHQAEDPESGWLTYRHWVRTGGGHTTTVPLAEWPAEINLSAYGLEPLSYDRQKKELSYRGAVRPDLRQRLLAGCEDPAYRAAIDRLFEESHCAPVWDSYGYNRGGYGNGGSEPVRDFGLALQVAYEVGAGEFRIEMTDGSATFAAVFDAGRKQVRLEPVPHGRPLRTAPLPDDFLRKPVLVECSLMDRQFLLAVEGQLVFPPWNYPAAEAAGAPPRHPVRMRAQDMRLHVGDLRLYRDVHYTSETARVGKKSWKLTNSEERREYFVLGDNSPVSVDSRFWPQGREMISTSLLGKPFLVHLPARSTEVQVGSWKGQVRIPDVSRIRYIR